MNWRYEAENARLWLDSYLQQATQVGDDSSGSALAGLEPGTVVGYSEPPCLRMVKESADVQEEVSVTVAGILCDKTLPPVFAFQRHIPFPPDIDPNHALEDARDSDFIRAEDNVVQYAKKTFEKNGTARIEPARPEDFKEGDVVEATGAFVAYPSSKDGDTFREAAQLKRKAAMEEAQVKKPARKKMKMATATNLKRAHISYGGAGGSRETTMANE